MYRDIKVDSGFFGGVVCICSGGGFRFRDIDYIRDFVFF